MTTETMNDPRPELDRTLGLDDRGPADLGDTRRPLPRGARAFLWLVMLFAVVIVALMLWFAWGPSSSEEVAGNPEATTSGIYNALRLPKIEPIPEQAIAPTPVQEAPAQMPVIVGGSAPLSASPFLDEVAARRLGSRLRSDSAAQSGADQAPTQQSDTGGDAGPLADKLRPLELAPSTAGHLGNRNMLITQGTMIDCVMQTRLVTAQAGMLTCFATHDVMSANGKVVLIDAGTKFTGYQSGGIVQGQPRAFVTWNRLETPTGVILNIGSPGTGPLGEPGVDGALDHHFWDRFGNAILLSLVGDLGNWASNQGNRGDNNIRFDNTREGSQEVIAKILEHSLDIPPTLYKNQGERVGIMVARDLDFSKVYDLQPTPERYSLR
ncbi:type IV secretion system protein VirB10 [Alcaligenaceae bacterium]|nr:type IV secretion system protein VirB10 [Alcaligenaceae bacterium]